MFYEKVLKIEQKTLLPNDPSLATTYGNIGGVYFKMKEYVKALSFYEKDIQICEKALPSDHYLLSISCDNIGNVYVVMGEYTKALSYLERALKINVRSLPSDHPQYQRCTRFNSNRQIKFSSFHLCIKPTSL